VAIVIAVLCVAGYVFAPKGDNQTYVTPSDKVELIWIQSMAVFNNPDTGIVLPVVRSPLLNVLTG
jgi:hypothetical protein